MQSFDSHFTYQFQQLLQISTIQNDEERYEGRARVTAKQHSTLQLRSQALKTDYVLLLVQVQVSAYTHIFKHPIERKNRCLSLEFEKICSK